MEAANQSFGPILILLAIIVSFLYLHFTGGNGLNRLYLAAALVELGRLDEALTAYERSAGLLADAGEGDLRALVLKAAAGIQLRRGKVTESGIRMIGALEAKRHATIFERLLRFFVRIAPH